MVKYITLNRKMETITPPLLKTTTTTKQNKQKRNKQKEVTLSCLHFVLKIQNGTQIRKTEIYFFTYLM